MVSQRFKIGFLGLIVTLLALIFIVSQIDLALFGQAWATARYGYVVPCIVFLLIGLVTRALRWQVLLSGGLSLARAFSIMNVAYLVNGVLPLRLGEVARVYLASRVVPPVPILKTTSTILVERLLDLMAVVLLMAFALATGPVPAELRIAGGMTALVAVAGLLMLFIFAANRALVHRGVSFGQRRIRALARLDLTVWLDQFFEGLAPLIQSRALSQALAWTALSWMFSVIAGYWLMFAFFEQASWTATALYIAAAAFAIALPAVPGNLGTYEAAILLALGALGYETSGAAVAFAVMVHAVNVFVHASTGVAGFIQEGISLEQLSRGVRELQQVAK